MIHYVVIAYLSRMADFSVRHYGLPNLEKYVWIAMTPVYFFATGASVKVWHWIMNAMRKNNNME